MTVSKKFINTPINRHNEIVLIPYRYVQGDSTVIMPYIKFTRHVLQVSDLLYELYLINVYIYMYVYIYMPIIKQFVIDDVYQPIGIYNK